jgi:hypothetical protein
MEVSEGGTCREPKRLSLTASYSLLNSCGRARSVYILCFDKLVDLNKVLFMRGVWGLFH